MQKNNAQRGLREAVGKYKNSVYGVIAANLRNKSEADDIFQETFLLYYTKDLYFENERAEKAWLVKTALNLCRKANLSIWNLRVDRLDDKAEIITQPPLTAKENDVLQAVRALSTKLREPVYLYYFEEMSVKEIAQLLGIRSGTVQVRLVRARKLLKERLKGEYFYE